MRERLSSGPHPTVVKYIFAEPLKQEAATNFSHVMAANFVHTLVLRKGGILDQSATKELLNLYMEMTSAGAGALTLDPSLEDLHFNIERYVIERLGPQVGGRMHTGRSRNDLMATTTRMRIREEALRMHERLASLRKVLLAKAEEHSDTVMTGYTHLQPAQPISFGFYMSAIADALARDAKRFQSAYRSTNQSPLGSAALAGSEFDLDRQYAAELLGFEGVIVNALDGVAARDFVTDLFAALASTTITISRAANDLYVWSTREFGLVTLSDDVCHVSSIMPQKKNALTLEHCRAKAAQVIGYQVACLAAMKGSFYTNVRDVNREAVTPLFGALSETEAAIELFAVTVEGLEVNRDRMLAGAKEDFSTATALADALVIQLDIPFRLAHEIVARVVRDAVSRGLDATRIDADLINQEAEDIVGKRLDLSDALIHGALDPVSSLNGRKTLGSANPTETRRMLTEAQSILADDEAWLGNARRHLESAKTRLKVSVDEVLSA